MLSPISIKNSDSNETPHETDSCIASDQRHQDSSASDVGFRQQDSDQPSSTANRPPVYDSDDYTIHPWFIRLFIAALILTLIAIRMIPDTVMTRWSMWWNNIDIPH
ncbi:hypothetical protein JW823_05475 [bacterium]|nr:hypothetical protein [candidate division CSSED10-310 bacterium]